MARHPQRTLPARLIVAAIAFGLIAACQSATVRQSLDARSGVTWTAERAPAVFARTETRYSRSARDYLYLGPVEVNERGTREYFVWVGIATTLDRGYVAPETQTEMPDRLYLVVRGEPFELELTPWSERLPALARIAVYTPSVEPRVGLAARITLDQLRLISAAVPESVRIGVADGATVEYFLWHDWSGWPGFLGQVAGPD